MKRATILAAAMLTSVGAGPGFAQEVGFKNIHEVLTGLREVPVISTVGHGQFRARISNDGSAIQWELSYANLEGEVQQAHIHFGPPNNTGGIGVFLCTNLGNGPAGTQVCPQSPATISGLAVAADVIGPTGQGIEAGALSELIAAIRAGMTYVNVHTTKWPAGEIRSQIAHDHSVR
jgi:hypothetical protein